MLKFKEFFLLRESAGYGTSEGKRTVPLSYTEFLDLYNKNCKLFNPSSMMIYRGNRQLEDAKFGFADPRSSSPRPSRNTYSFTMWLMESMDEWSKYPLRSKSLICSTDYGYASGYGKTFNVIPYDNAKIGVCASMDFFDSMSKGSQIEVSSYNGFINRIIEGAIKLLTEHGPDKNIASPNFTTGASLTYQNDDDPFSRPPATNEHFFSLLKTLDRFFLKHPELIDEMYKNIHSYYDDDNTVQKRRVIDGISRKIPLTELLSEPLSPKKNDFKLFNMQNFNAKNLERKDHYGGHEVWTDGPALFVEVATFNDLVEKKLI